jgi:exodeoxyribonuclease VII small subunit
MYEGTSYNEAFTKLESICKEIEGGKIDIDTLSEKVKEASTLIKICKEKIYKVDEDIKKIIENIDL